MSPPRPGTIAKTALLELVGEPLGSPPKPPPKTRAGSGGGGSNVERLVAIAGELLRTFGASEFASMAADQIRSRTNEQTARQALSRIHELTGPPYR